MGCCKIACLVGLLLPVVFVVYVHYKLTQVPELPDIDLEKWWGPGEPKKVDNSIKPFKVEFTDDMVNDLKRRLSTTYLTPPLEGVNFEYGFNTNYLKEVIKFWSNDYDFKEREAFLNKFPHFKTNVQGLDIHFIHVKPKVSSDIKVLPLLLAHGWPGSVREFYGIIPLLTTPKEGQNFVFEIIAPSLPGYGFSQAATKPGFGADQIAIVFRNLMHRLGHKEFYLHGGDWGALIIELMSVFFPKEVLAVHTNSPFLQTGLSTLSWILGSIYSPLVVSDMYRERMYPFLDKVLFVIEESGYMHLQGTKPDTVGVALRDSPAGLAAYILEKFSTWTNPGFKNLPNGGITKKFSLTDVLDNVMIYWSTNCITTSVRLYSETFGERYEGLGLAAQPVSVPTAVANFKHELFYNPETILRQKYKNLIQMSHFEDGGHFASFEVPQLVAEDVWQAISKVRKTENEKKKKKQEL